MKPLIQVAISALTTSASVGVMAIITGILLVIKSRKTQNHCDSENNSLSDHLERLRTFAKEKLATPPDKKSPCTSLPLLPSPLVPMFIPKLTLTPLEPTNSKTFPPPRNIQISATLFKFCGHKILARTNMEKFPIFCT